MYLNGKSGDIARQKMRKAMYEIGRDVFLSLPGRRFSFLTAVVPPESRLTAGLRPRLDGGTEFLAAWLRERKRRRSGGEKKKKRKEKGTEAISGR